MDEAALLLSSHQALYSDTGALLRATELAVGAVLGREWRGRLGPGHDIHALARALETDSAVVSRLRKVDASGIQRLAEAGGTLLVPVVGGWLVATTKGGILVTPQDEQRFSLRPKRLADIIGEAPTEAVLLEPRLALSSTVAEDGASRSPWRRLRRFVALESAELWALVLYAVVLGGLSLAVPVAVQVLVNTIAFGSVLQPLVILSLLLLGVLLFAGLVQVIEWYAVEVLQRRLFVRVAEDFARRIPLLSYGVHDRLDARELTNRFFEVVSLQKALGTLFVDALGLALRTFVGLLLLGFYHPALLAFNAALIAALGVVLMLGYGAVATAQQESAAKYKVAAWLEAVAQRPALFKGATAGTIAATQADALIRSYLTARRQHYTRVFRQLVGGVGVQIGTLVAVLGLGGWLVMEGELTLGQLVAAELVVGIIGNGFLKLGKHLETVYDLLASLDKLGKVIDLPVDAAAPRTGPEGRAAGFDLQHVTLQHSREGGSGPVLTACIPARARLLLEGPGGSGKTRWLETLAGLREPESGSVRLHDATTPESPAAELKARALLVRSDDVVAGTVFENLQLGAGNLDEATAWSVLHRVALDRVVANLQGGLHAALLPGGAPLSSTQVRRLVLARALLVAPDLLLIDGTLDHLGQDGEPSAPLLDEFFGVEAPWTAVVVSDDPVVQQRCNRNLSLREVT